MAEQPELDLPLPPPPAAQVTARPRAFFGGFSSRQILAGVAVLILLVWTMWVTKTLIVPKQDELVKVRLSAIVGEYVQAQSRSASPPEQVESEMRTFLASLDKELQRRSAKGQVVLVGEAVLTKNVPDITDSLKAAVYAAGVPQPKQASAQELQRMEQLGMAASASSVAPPGLAWVPGPTSLDPLAAAQPMAPAVMPEAGQDPYSAPVASVSTFGGPGGNGGQ